MPIIPTKLSVGKPPVNCVHVIAAVCRFIEPAPRHIRRRIYRPRRTPCPPQRGVQHARILRIDRNLNRADIIRIVRLKQNLLPRRAAVGRAIQPALRIRRVYIPQRRDIHAIRIRRVHHHASNLPRAFKSNVRPSLARVGRFEHSDAVGMLRANIRLARADIHNVWIRRSNRNRADGADGNALIRNRNPRPAGIFRFPNASANGAEVECVRLVGMARYSVGSPSAHRPDVPPHQSGEQAGNVLPLLRKDPDRH